MVLGPHAPPSGGVAAFLQALFARLPAGRTFWYGYGDLSCDGIEKKIVEISDYNPGLMIRRDAQYDVVVDSATVFLEYPRPRLIWQWILAMWLGRVRWLKVVHDVNLPDRFAAFGALRRWHARIAAHFVWRYVAVNAELADWLGRELASPAGVEVIPSLLSVDRLEDGISPPPEFQQMREAFDLVICAVGAMNEEYGFQHVAAAASELQSEGSDRIGLLLLCTDFTEQAGFSDSVRSVFPQTTIVADLPRAQVLAIFDGCDVVVRAVRRESYGLSRVEAICQGTPVVATRTGETRGMLGFDFGDISSLVGQLKNALTDQARDQAEQWADVFRKEAEANTQRWLRLIDQAGRRA
jgi:glycosyltransferase involved in cell wall biosynthesis